MTNNPQMPRKSTNPAEVPGLDAAWATAREDAPFVMMALADFADAPEAERQILIWPGAGGETLFLPTLRKGHRHKITLGERLLFSIPAQALALCNPWLASAHPEAHISDALTYMLRTEKADLIDLGEIPEDGALRNALNRLPWPYRKLTRDRKAGRRWLIDLPETLDDYFALLSSSSRQSLRRKIRKLEKTFDTQLEIITDATGIERFLEEGEKISRKTYQWNVGQRLVNDAETRARYKSLAEEGRLHCCLLSLDGTPRAFMRGTLEGPFYHYETPGFDPEFGRHSIGNVLFLYGVRDLIENRDCTTFDFGTGGDDVGYKSTFGTRNLAARTYYMVALNRPRGIVIWIAQAMINIAKNLADKVLRQEGLRSFLRKRLRKYGG